MIDASEEDDRISGLKKDLNEFSKICNMNNIKIGLFTSTRLDRICKRINNIWSCLTNHYIRRFISIDSSSIRIFKDTIISYTSQLGVKFEDPYLNLDFFAQISGYFYTNIYKPIENISFEYEVWQDKEERYKILSLASMGVILVSVLLITLIPCMCFCLKILLISVSIILFIWEIYAFVKLIKLSDKVCR